MTDRPQQRPGRDFFAVMANVVALVPETETELLKRLTKVVEDAGFHAPEGRHLDWRALLRVLTDHFGEDPPAEGWGAEVARLLRGGL